MDRLYASDVGKFGFLHLQNGLQGLAEVRSVIPYSAMVRWVDITSDPSNPGVGLDPSRYVKDERVFQDDILDAAMDKTAYPETVCKLRQQSMDRCAGDIRLCLESKNQFPAADHSKVFALKTKDFEGFACPVKDDSNMPYTTVQWVSGKPTNGVYAFPQEKFLKLDHIYQADVQERYPVQDGDGYVMRMQSLKEQLPQHMEFENLTKNPDAKYELNLVADVAVADLGSGYAELKGKKDGVVSLQWLTFTSCYNGQLYGRSTFTDVTEYPADRVYVSDVVYMDKVERDTYRKSSLKEDAEIFAKYEESSKFMEGMIGAEERFSAYYKDYKPDPELSAAEVAEERARMYQEIPKEFQAEKASVAAKDEKSEKSDVKSSHLLRINTSMIHDMKGCDTRKAVTVGLQDPEGTKRVGTIYVGTSSIHKDRCTEHLPDRQKKSYVAISPTKTYDFVTSVKNPEGKFDRNVTKISGQTILDQNKAYMKERMASYQQKLSDLPVKDVQAAARQCCEME